MKKILSWCAIVFSCIILLGFVQVIIIDFDSGDSTVARLYPDTSSKLQLLFGFLLTVFFFGRIIKKAWQYIKAERIGKDEDLLKEVTAQQPDNIHSSDEVFQLNEEGLKQLKRILIKRLALIFGFVIIIAVGYSTYTSAKAHNDIITIIAPAVILLIVVFASSKRTIAQQLAVYQTYKLSMHTNYISREQANVPIMEIAYDEIESITKAPEGGLIIRGTNPIEIILIPVQLEQLEQLEQRLAKIKEITPDNRSFLKRKAWLLSVIVLVGLFATIISTDNKIIICLAGGILILMIGYAFYKIRTDKSIDQKIKDAAWYLLLIAMSVVIAVYVKITRLP
jgi:hypothetical protein